ncbi:hypothetical protein L1987_14889 [Smallanthus sonchifolius]|uniref:Uncharacterized protein n=1 Tax=Smallanthus sonchifolius TaxID=185202 RepID=A0ACB9J447_9ASTR|nr:hypothetical protein L1987_14889 [Smallanthus sonchifolius]
MSSYSANISSNSSFPSDDGSQSPISWSRLISPPSSFSGSLLPSKHNVKPELIFDATSHPALMPEVINISCDSKSEDQESHTGTISEAQLPFKKRKLTCLDSDTRDTYNLEGMPPRRDPDNTVANTSEASAKTTAISTLLTQQLDAVLPTIVTQINNSTAGSSGSVCTFKHFNYCNPHKEGALAVTWDKLKEIMIEEFCPSNEMKKLEIELWDLTQDSGESEAYTTRFHELCILVPHLVTPLTRKIDRYIRGLLPQIRGTVVGSSQTTLEAAIHLSASLTDDLVKSGVLFRKGDKRVKEEVAKKPEYRHKKQKNSKVFSMVTPAVTVAQVAPAPAPGRKPYS